MLKKTDQSELNRKKREQEGCRLRRWHLFHRLKNIFAIASGICFQRALQCRMSACLGGLSVITVSQWSTVILHGVKWYFGVLNVFPLHPLFAFTSFNFYRQEVLSVLITQLSCLSRAIKNSTFLKIIFLWVLLKPWNLDLWDPILPLTSFANMNESFISMNLRFFICLMGLIKWHLPCLSNLHQQLVVWFGHMT